MSASKNLLIPAGTSRARRVRFALTSNLEEQPVLTENARLPSGTDFNYKTARTDSNAETPLLPYTMVQSAQYSYRPRDRVASTSTREQPVPSSLDI